MKSLIAITITILVIAHAAENAELDWWQESVVYQIYPRSFQDSNGDGVGDLNGIKSRIPYLVEIGVGAVWLSPVYESPMVDFGYDISNFTNVDPIFGTLDDMKELASELKANNIRLIMDYIPNHSSDQHQWFIDSVSRIDPYTDYYTWKDANGTDPEGNPIPPNNWVSVFGGSMWKWNEDRQQFYLHQFAVQQPDLNLENPVVEEEMLAAMKFWLDLGVDGFRMDAVPHMFEDQKFPDEPKNENAPPDTPPEEYAYWNHPYTFDLPKVLESLAKYRALNDIYSLIDGRTRVMMTEGYVTPIQELMKYYGTAENPIAHFPFNFEFISTLKGNFTAKFLKETINSWMDAMPAGRTANWLIGNHDNPRASKRFGKELIDATNMFVLLLPGTAITYYGEEIGMENTFLTYSETVDPAGCNAGPDRYELYSRDPERTPMQWDASQNAGFSSGNDTWLPLNPNFMDLNVDVQNSSAESHLHIYKSLLQLRKSDAWKFGTLETKDLGGSASLFGLNRQYEDQSILLVINLGSFNTILDASTFSGVPNRMNVYTRSLNFGDSDLIVGSEVPTNAIPLAPRDSLVLVSGI